MLRCCGDISRDATSIDAESLPNMANSSDGLIAIDSADSPPSPSVMNDAAAADLPPILNGALLPPPTDGLNAAGGTWGEPTPFVPPDRSRNASDGLNPSGLPCCELDSVDADERAVFLRMGRIHGGLALAVGVSPSGRGESSGIWVTLLCARIRIR
jgi:hypothetical protein